MLRCPIHSWRSRIGAPSPAILVPKVWRRSLKRNSRRPAALSADLKRRVSCEWSSTSPVQGCPKTRSSSASWTLRWRSCSSSLATRVPSGTDRRPGGTLVCPSARGRSYGERESSPLARRRLASGARAAPPVAGRSSLRSGTSLDRRDQAAHMQRRRPRVAP